MLAARRIILFSMALLLIPVTDSFAKKKKGKKAGYKVMKQVRVQSRIHKTQRSEVYMLIETESGSEREMYFNYLKKHKGKKSSSMIKFFKPASIEGTGLRSVSSDNKKKTTQWIYLPAVGGVKKLSANGKSESFMGSDFTNSDIAGRSLKQDKHKLVDEDEKYYYIKSKPNSKKDIYSKLELKVHKKVMIPIEVKFYNKKKEHFKTMRSLRIKKIEGMYVVIKSVMENLETKGKTTLEVSDVEVDIDISNADVSIKSLKK